MDQWNLQARESFPHPFAKSMLGAEGAISSRDHDQEADGGRFREGAK